MIAITEADATRTYPELARLAEFHGAGWCFRPFPDERGELVGIVGWRTVLDATDALWIFDRSACRAVRLLADAPGASGGIAWDHIGDLASCVSELMALPEPGQRLTPRLIRAAAPTLWTP